MTAEVKTFRCDNEPLLSRGRLLTRVAANGCAVSDQMHSCTRTRRRHLPCCRLMASHLSLLLHGIYSLFVAHIKK